MSTNTQTPSQLRAVVRCVCGLNQFDAQRCRRCRLPLHPAEAKATELVAAFRVQMRKPIQRSRPEGVTATSQALGRIVCRLRSPLMSQRDLATRSGISNTMVHNLERGRINPSLRVITALAKALNRTASELLHEAELLAPTMDAAQIVRFGPQRVTAAEMQERTA